MDSLARVLRVLVVDDDPDVRAVLSASLTSAGYEVEQAADGVEAIGSTARSRPDLIILDVSMPRMDGWEVARQVRADHRLSEIPVVFLTAKADEVDVLKGLSLGAVEYVTKPFSPENVTATVGMLLGVMDGQMREERRQARVNLLTRAQSPLAVEVPDGASKAGSRPSRESGLPDLPARRPAA